MKFTAQGYVSTRNNKNTVEVENVSYWISIQDILRIAQSKGIKTEGLRCDEYGIDGEKVSVTIHRDNFKTWAELANQPAFCPNVI